MSNPTADAHLAHARTLAAQATATAPGSPERRRVFAQLTAALEALQAALAEDGPQASDPA